MSPASDKAYSSSLAGQIRGILVRGELVSIPLLAAWVARIQDGWTQRSASRTDTMTNGRDAGQTGWQKAANGRRNREARTMAKHFLVVTYQEGSS